ncbi:MAG: SH3 domain-containing protein [Kiritimatiellia bacterium]
MKHILISMFALALMWRAPDLYAQRREVRVTAPQASVLDAPRPNALVIGQLSRGKSLHSTGRTQGDWLEIEAPSDITGWVFGELLRGDIVEASSVRIRSGAGVGFEGLGTLVKGDRITRRGAQGGWVSFEGIPAMRVWVERSMVSAPAAVDLTAAVPPVAAPSDSPARVVTAPPPPPPPPPAPVASVPVPVPAPVTPPAEVSAPAPTPVPVVRRWPALPDPVVPLQPPPPPPVRRVSAPPPLPIRRPSPPSQALPAAARPDQMQRAKRALPPGFRLLGHLPQGQIVRMEGIVRPVGFGLLRPSAYRLASSSMQVPGRTVAYLVSDDISLPRQVGRAVVLSGTRFWLMGVRDPVIVVQSIH